MTYIPSAYKNKRIPHRAYLCAVCQLQTRREEPAELLQLTHGVSVWLCPRHGSEEFLTMRGGRDFVLTLMRAWQAAGCYTRRRDRALSAHLKAQERPRRRTEAALPGSYSWKALRNETEHRAAAGESLRSILLDLRARHAHDYADVPSERTIRRWYTDRRWARGVRTRVRPGYERRDHRHAARAQRDRVAIVRRREAHAAAGGDAGTRPDARLDGGRRSAPS
jgi:hypothetical protein